MKLLSSISKVVIFLIGIWLVLSNYRVVGWTSILLMLVGLGLLLVLLYSYNKKFE